MDTFDLPFNQMDTGILERLLFLKLQLKFTAFDPQQSWNPLTSWVIHNMDKQSSFHTLPKQYTIMQKAYKNPDIKPLTMKPPRDTTCIMAALREMPTAVAAVKPRLAPK